MKALKYRGEELKKVLVRIRRLPVIPKPLEVSINRSIKEQLLESFQEKDIRWQEDVNTKIGSNFRVTITQKTKNKKKVRFQLENLSNNISSGARDKAVKGKIKKKKEVKKSGKRSRVKVSIPSEVEEIKDQLVENENYQIPASEEEMEEEDSEFPRWPVPSWSLQEEIEKVLSSRSQAIDPGLIFAKPEAPDLDAIFTDKQASGGRDIWRSPAK